MIDVNLSWALDWIKSVLNHVSQADSAMLDLQELGHHQPEVVVTLHEQVGGLLHADVEFFQVILDLGVLDHNKDAI